MSFWRIPACLTIAILLGAQPRAGFDVASIRPADPNNNRFGMGFSANGRTLTVDGLNLAQMVTMAYHVRAEELSLAPSLDNAGWIRSDRYDISGKVEGTEPLSKQQQDQLFQQLLADPPCSPPCKTNSASKSSRKRPRWTQLCSTGPKNPPPTEFFRTRLTRKPRLSLN